MSPVGCHVNRALKTIAKFVAKKTNNTATVGSGRSYDTDVGANVYDLHTINHGKSTYVLFVKPLYLVKEKNATILQ